MADLDEHRPEYEQLLNCCVIKPVKCAEIDGYVTTIVANRDRYEIVGSPLGVPWYFIGVIHTLECGLSFNRHLHNGDPLTARTVHIPRGRPKTGQPRLRSRKAPSMRC